MRIAAYHRYGGPEVVGVEEHERPEPGPGEVRVRVHAASVGAADAAGRSGSPWFARFAFGLHRPRNAVLGSDFAGVVDAVGEGVTRFVVGDRVFGATGVDGGATPRPSSSRRTAPSCRCPTGSPSRRPSPSATGR